MSQIKSLAAIKANRLFHDIPEGDIKLSAGQKDFLEVRDGDIVFKSGDAVDHVYLLLEGEVKIKYNAAIDGQRIFEKAANDFFGEREFLEGTNRASSAVAMTNCTIYLLRRKDLNEMVTRNRNVLNNLQGYDPNRMKTAEFRAAREFMTHEFDEMMKNPEDEITGFKETKSLVKTTIAEPQPEPEEETISWNPVPEPEPPAGTPEQDGFAPAAFSWGSFSPQDTPPAEEQQSGFSGLHLPEAEEEQQEQPFHFSLPDDGAPATGSALPPRFAMPGTFGNAEPLPATDAGGLEPQEGFSWDFSPNFTDEAADGSGAFSEGAEADDGFRALEGNADEEIQQRRDEVKKNFWGSIQKNTNQSMSVTKEELPEPEPEPEPEQQFNFIPQAHYIPPPAPARGGLSNDQLKLLINAAQMVNSNIKIDEVLRSIVQAASSLTSADRGTLYIVDADAGELWSKVIRGDNIEEIRLKIGQGLAGWVAQTGETVNLADVSGDSRFDSNVDKATGYKTRNMLCFPIKNKDSMVIGVLQLLNSANGQFGEIDEEFLEALSAHAAIALENAELVEQLLKTDRLTSLGKVAKFLISDIKKPILTIKHLAEHIRKKNLSGEVNQVVSMMAEQTNIVVDLIITTLSYSEGKTILNKKVQTVNRVVDELLENLAEYVESRKVKLFKKFGPDVMISVDKKELYMAFFQLTKNACDAMAGGGALYVSTALNEPGDAVHITFKDTGLGIPDTIRDKIFEPFMSQGKKHGVGLGLPITEKIVKEHGGVITVESELGEGASFTITLPVIKEL